MVGVSVTTRWIVRPGVLVAGAVALALLAGCSGGGGSGTSAPPPTATATTARPPTATAATASTPTATAVRTATVPATSPPTPSATPTAVATAPPTATGTAGAVATATVTATVTPTVTPTITLSPTPTATPLTGPVVTAFGIADESGAPFGSQGRDSQDRLVFRVSAADGFVVFLEGRPGSSRLPVGTIRWNTEGGAAAQPDVQIVSSNDLGRPTTAVCDGDLPVRGGVPAIVPPRFDPEPAVSDALNDFGCRFKVFAETDFACTQSARGNFVFADAGTVVQFCTLVTDALTFPVGDTVLSARLRDTDGNAGPTAEIVVRVGGGR